MTTSADREDQDPAPSFMHGEEDPRVPPYESAQLSRALKKEGKTFFYYTSLMKHMGLRIRTGTTMSPAP